MGVYTIMNINYLYILFAWIITIIALIKFIPKEKIREAQLVFLFKGTLTWALGLIVVYYHLIEYPVRLLPSVSHTSFTFEYLVYPSICAIFNMHFPEKKNRLQRALYYCYYCSGITILEVLVEKYTQIIKYIHWHWYITWITLWITFFISRSYYKWYFKIYKDKY